MPNTDTTTAAPIRKLDRRVETIVVLQTGLSLGLGYDAQAYLAGSVHDPDEIAVGSRILGTYRMDEGTDGSRFARIMSVEDIMAPADDSKETSDEGQTASPAAPMSRKLDRRVESVGNMRHGRRLNLGYETDAYIANSVYDGAIAVGDRLTGTYRMEGEGDEKFARITELSAVAAASAADAGADEEAVALAVTALGNLSSNNRFSAQMADGSKVVVQAMGRCVMYAKSLARNGAELGVTGRVNREISGQADSFFDAVRVEKANAL